MRKQPASDKQSTAIVTVLSVSPLAEDHISLKAIFEHSNWVLHQAERVSTACELLEAHKVGAVLCERDLQKGSWIELLQQMQAMPCAPPLIVTSRLADDRLWSEALNLGAYDVLAKPFERRELFRSVSHAWLNWRYRFEQKNSGLMVMRAAG